MKNSMIQHVESVRLSKKNKQRFHQLYMTILLEPLTNNLVKKTNDLLCFLSSLGNVGDPKLFTLTMDHTVQDNKVSHS